LEQSDSVGANTGWLPQHVQLQEGNQLVAVMPLYIKRHSYGEYVFDWSWAEAYQRHGLLYYPKLVSAIPFTPITGARYGIAAGADRAAVRDALYAAPRCTFSVVQSRLRIDGRFRRGIQFAQA
jgi:predicted N-acyltransferase